MKNFPLTFNGSGADEKVLPSGTYLRVLTAATPLSIVVLRAGSLVADLSGVNAGVAWESLDDAGALRVFDEVRVSSATAQTVTLAVGRGRLLNDALTVSAAISIAQGTAVTDPAAVAVVTGAAPTVLVAAAVGRKGLRFYNAGTFDVYLGSLLVSVAAGAVKIAPGQLWLEDDAADAAWYGVHAAAASQSVRVQVVS